MDRNGQKYRAFVEVVECGSFTTAGDKLGVSQSAVSRMVADLEGEWGVKLLERTRSGALLTSDGEALIPAVRSLCRAYEDLRDDVARLRGLESGIIRIGTVTSMATQWLSKIVKRFHEDYPNIEYELLLGTYSEIEDWVSQGRVDCAFLRLPTRTPFDVVIAEPDELKVVLPLDHPRAKGKAPFPAQELASNPFMLLGEGNESEVADFLAANKIALRPQLETWDDYTIMAMVEAGLGIAVLPSLVLQRVPYKIAVKSLDVHAERTIGMVVRDKSRVSTAMTRFFDYLQWKTA